MGRTGISEFQRNAARAWVQAQQKFAAVEDELRQAVKNRELTDAQLHEARAEIAKLEFENQTLKQFGLGEREELIARIEHADTLARRAEVTIARLEEGLALREEALRTERERSEKLRDRVDFLDRALAWPVPRPNRR